MMTILLWVGAVILWLVVGAVVTRVAFMIDPHESFDGERELFVVFWPVIIVIGVFLLLMEFLYWIGGGK